MARLIVKGTRPGRMPRPSRQVEDDLDRVCAEQGCTTMLSRYNNRDRCWQHSEIVYPNYRGRRLAQGT
ncbi:MAG: hypothetical protein ACRDJP_09120 [Actinomycetota bacterium]